MRLKTILILLVVSVFWTACSGDKKNDKAKFDIPYQDMEPKILTVKEYQKVLFDIDTADFKKGLESLIPEYSSVLGTSINDIQANYVKAFVTDTFCRHLYEW